MVILVSDWELLAESEQEPRPAEPAATPAAPARYGNLRALQSAAGNRAVQRLMRDARHGRQESPSAEQRANMAWASAFVAHGIYGPDDVVGDNGIGGFYATYDPGAGPGRLLVEMGVSAKFKDSLEVGADGRVSAARPDLEGAARKINMLPAAERAAALTGYQWQLGETEPWNTALRKLIDSRWGNQFSFFINRPQYEWIGATVDVRVDVHEYEYDAEYDHLRLMVWKLPEPEFHEHYQSSVTSWSRVDTRDQTMELNSQGILPRPVSPLVWEVLFDDDSDAFLDGGRGGKDSASVSGPPGPLDAGPPTAAQHSQNRIVKRMQMLKAGSHVAGHRAVPVRLIAVTGAGDAGADRGLATRRMEAVRHYIEQNGFSVVETRLQPASPLPTMPAGDVGRAVFVEVDDGRSQIPAVHEFGHAFGLDDEYPRDEESPGQGPPQPKFDEPAHKARAAQMTGMRGEQLPEAYIGYNNNVMSTGDVLRPQHYAMFYKALVQLTQEKAWSIGAPTTRPRPAGEPDDYEVQMP